MTGINGPEAVVRKVVPQEKAATFTRRGFTGINGPDYKHAIPDAPPLPGEPRPWRWRPDPLFRDRGNRLGYVIVSAGVLALAAVFLAAVWP